jgi:4-hydroxythreonine-4-phosphate dehydrogenase
MDGVVSDQAVQARRRRIAVIPGDRYGVGPEIVARYLGERGAPQDADLVVLGDRRVLERGAVSCGLGLEIATIGTISDPIARKWALLDIQADIEVEPLGRLSAQAGAECLALLRLAAEAGQSGAIDGIVYAPLNKQAMRMAGHAAGDELDFLVQHMPPEGAFGEINILGAVWTSRVTSHIPLGRVVENLTPENLDKAIRLLDGALRRGGIGKPRLALSALNPHAGEGGAYGREEIDLLAPTVARARTAGMDLAGPFPSDTIFPRAVSGQFDGVVTLFHDQGQIALKAMGLGQGVTLLAGLPIPVATPAHGTAFDIAGTGTARDGGFRAALDLVARMARPMES